MEVHGIKSSKQFSDLDLMPKTSINTNTTISNQSIVSIYDSSTRDDLPNSIELSQGATNANEKCNGKINCCMKWLSTSFTYVFSYNIIHNEFFRNFSRERMANRLLTLPECTSSNLYICVLFNLLNGRISAVGWTIGRGNICRK